MPEPRRAPRRSAARPAAAAAPRTPAPVTGRRSASAAITPEPGPAARRGQAARVAVRHARVTGRRRAARRRAAPRRARTSAGARGLVLALDRLRLRARRARHPHRPRGQRRGAHALDRPGEVARRRPARRAAARRRARARASDGSPRDLHRQPVRRGDADQRRAAHGEPLDRLRGVLGAASSTSTLLVPGSRVWSSTCSRSPSQRSGGGESVRRPSRAILRADGPRPVGHRPAQGLRLGAGAPRRRPRGRRRRAVRAARAQRRGQVDAREDRLRARPPDRRARRVCGSPAGSAGGARRAGLPRRAVPLPRLVHGRRAARAAPGARRLGRRRATSGASCSSSSSSTTSRTAAWARCRRACSSGSASPRR